MVFPSVCHLCETPCINQICTPCQDLFSRGLRVKRPISRKYKNVNIHSIRYNMGKYYTENHIMPESIIMNMPTYMDFRSANPRLPEKPFMDNQDTYTSITGVAIHVVESKVNGYEFRGPFEPDVLLP